MGIGINPKLILPELILGGTGIILLLVEAFCRRRGVFHRTLMTALAIIGVLASAVSFAIVPLGVVGFEGSVLNDGFAFYFRFLMLLALLLIFLISREYAENKGIPLGEYYALLAFATTGAMFLVMAGDLVTLYVGLELLSVSSYILAGLLRGEDASLEASLKYLVNGATASAFLLFGFSLLYGVTGTVNLAELAKMLAAAKAGAAAIAAMLLVLAGLGFKLATVPFHLWVPDTYQGAPTPVTAFLSVGSKGAALGVFLRLFFVAFEPLKGQWMGVLAVLALLTMTLGNVAALPQTNVKRLLGYSSITQAGYILAAIATGSDRGFAAAMFYILAYTFMNIGIFSVLVTVANEGYGEDLHDLNGLARREPVLAFLGLIFMLSLVGIPPLAGFWAKFFVFRAAVDTGLVWLAVAVAANSAISVGYYYNIVRSMYVTDPRPDRARHGLPAGFAMQVGLALAAAGVLVLGFLPDPFHTLVSGLVLGGW